MSLGNAEYTKKKDRHKVVKVIVQLAVLFVIAYVAVHALFTLTTYKHYSEEQNSFPNDKGFIAVSYFGVERLKNAPSLIPADRLRQHLQALKKAGYVTITQEDIINYYHHNVNLPEKALFLSFEDGRRDTAIFAQKILEEFNYKATILTYAENLDTRDPKFLRTDDLLELEKTTFWELGTNGYRLYYINVFDRYNNYLGEISPLEHIQISPYLGRRYNHYLMDYIRDRNGFPKESYSHMKNRVDYDYQSLRDVYKETIGRVPGLYILMHSNTGGFGNNPNVNAVNHYWIPQLFDMNFNREGFSHNQRNSSIYDLSRIQPQPYWYSNHLLMRINDDIEDDLPFVIGDEVRHIKWDIQKGALEAQDERLILTSVPEGNAVMQLKDTAAKDLKLTGRLTGNQFGLQRLIFRADNNLQNYICVELYTNFLYIREKVNGVEKELFSLNLDLHDGKQLLSIEEDKKNAEIREYETFIRYASDVETARYYSEKLRAKQQEQVRTVADGAKPYIAPVSVNATGDREIQIQLKDNNLSVSIDGKNAAENVAISSNYAGNILFETAWGEFGWSQRNIVDDVYDGVVEELVITENTGAEKEAVIYSDKLDTFSSYKLKLQRKLEALLNWFMDTF